MSFGEEADLLTAQGIKRHAPEDLCFSAPATSEAEEDLYEGRLACAIRPKQAEDLASADLEVYATESREALLLEERFPEDLVEVSYSYDRVRERFGHVSRIRSLRGLFEPR